LKEFIAILDSFDLAIAAHETDGAMEKGMLMIRAQMESILSTHGVKKINIKSGEPYDPQYAEAMLVEPSEIPEGGIIEEITPGYMLHDKVLRPAQVKISKGPSS
jgi:molecular chaperone GrpE